MTSARRPEQLQPNSCWGLSKAGLWLPGRTVGIWSLTLGDGLMPDHAPLSSWSLSCHLCKMGRVGPLLRTTIEREQDDGYERLDYSPHAGRAQNYGPVSPLTPHPPCHLQHHPAPPAPPQPWLRKPPSAQLSADLMTNALLRLHLIYIITP